MLIRRVAFGFVSVGVAAFLTSCATQPRYSYYRVSCAVAGSYPGYRMSGPSTPSSTRPPATSKNSAPTTPQQTTSRTRSRKNRKRRRGCVVAVQNGYGSGYGYSGYGYYPYPYYSGYGYPFGDAYWGDSWPGYESGDFGLTFESGDDFGDYDGGQFDQSDFHGGLGDIHDGDSRRIVTVFHGSSGGTAEGSFARQAGGGHNGAASSPRTRAGHPFERR